MRPLAAELQSHVTPTRLIIDTPKFNNINAVISYGEISEYLNPALGSSTREVSLKSHGTL